MDVEMLALLIIIANKFFLSTLFMIDDDKP